MPLVFRSSIFIFSAAGFMAISASTESPGVYTSVDENCIWKPLTPGSVPAGARISAGKSGKVAKIVAEQRRGVGELAAGDLHAVAGIAAKRMTARSITSRLRLGSSSIVAIVSG